MLEQSRRVEENREDTLKLLAREQMERANMASDERVETKRFLRAQMKAEKEREMEEAILKVSLNLLKPSVNLNNIRTTALHCHVILPHPPDSDRYSHSTRCFPGPMGSQPIGPR